MTKTIIFLLIMILSMIVIRMNVMTKSLNYYDNTTPQMNVKDYFNGPINAWGILQDWRGRVIKQFDIKMIGKWEGDTGTLTEHFQYYDGHTQERMWTITKLENGKYEGRASDVPGKALGNTNGSAAQWSYVMDLEVDKTIYRIHFDDWMWAMNDGVLINRTSMKKLGVTVAELTIFMQKQSR